MTFVFSCSQKLLKNTFNCVRLMPISKFHAEQSRVSRTLWTSFNASLKVVLLPG